MNCCLQGCCASSTEQADSTQWQRSSRGDLLHDHWLTKEPHQNGTAGAFLPELFSCLQSTAPEEYHCVLAAVKDTTICLLKAPCQSCLLLAAIQHWHINLCLLKVLCQSCLLLDAIQHMHVTICTLLLERALRSHTPGAAVGGRGCRAHGSKYHLECLLWRRVHQGAASHPATREEELQVSSANNIQQHSCQLVIIYHCANFRPQ